MVKFEEEKCGNTLGELIDVLVTIKNSDDFSIDSFVEVIDSVIHVNKFGKDGAVVIDLDSNEAYDLMNRQEESSKRDMDKLKERADLIASGKEEY